MKKLFVFFIICILLIITFLPASEAVKELITRRFDIQGAIDNSINGDVIIVPDGVYSGGIDFKGKAIKVMSENGPENCIINGDDTIFGVKFDNNENPDSILQGFTITNCRTENYCGSGIFCGRYTSPTIIDCVISGNTAIDTFYELVSGGGGIYCGRYSSPNISHCIISDNVAECTLDIWEVGGGVLLDRFCTPTFFSCEITNNQVIAGYNGWAYGGGVCGPYASPQFFSCLIANNIADVTGGIGAHACGGGLVFKFGASLVMKSCMVVNNFARTSGGGILIRYSANATIEGCTFSGNKAYGGGESGMGGGISCMSSAHAWIRNTIMWDNYPKEIYICGEYGEDTLVYIDFSDIKGGEDEIIISAWYPDILNYGPMNIDTEPYFKNAGNGDYHLQMKSPCIETGDPNPNINAWAYDFDLQTREYDVPWITIPDKGPMDIGADEVIAEGSGPDLYCEGGLSWKRVKPGKKVTDSFTIENIGEPVSYLDWEIIEWPGWGTWTFTPQSGDDLTPEDGEIAVKVEVIAPDEQNQQFDGNVKIVNKLNSEDNHTISVSLVTPRIKVINRSFLKLQEINPYLLSILKLLLQRLRL